MLAPAGLAAIAGTPLTLPRQRTPEVRHPPLPHSAALLLLAGLVATPAAAQRMSLSPQIGFYVPTEDLYTLASLGGGSVGTIEAGPSFGAALGISLGNRFGISVTGAYVPTTFRLAEDGAVESRQARLFNGSAQALVFLLPRSAPLSLFLRGGMGVVSRGGVAFTDAAETSDVGGVFGVGAGLSLGGIPLTAGADLFRYTAAYAGRSATSSEFAQRDIQLKFGIGVPIGPQ